MTGNPSSHIPVNLFYRSLGHHVAAWRHPSTDPANVMDLENIIAVISRAEEGLLDSVFLGDSVALAAHPWGYITSSYDPLLLLAAIAARTKHIGLIGTVSTTYQYPYNTARQLASLDHLSGGRAGWNIVTTQAPYAAANFGLEHPLEHDARYVLAEEVVDIVKGLWDTWDADAIVADKEEGTYVDGSKVRPLNHRGAAHSVAGPLNLPRPPQGHPFIVQAGSSTSGMQLGSRVADAIFTAQQDMPSSLAFTQEMKSRAEAHGRRRDSIKILPGIAPILGSTVAEAQKLQEELNDGLVPEHTLPQLSQFLELDLSAYPLDGPVPLDAIRPSGELEGHRSRAQAIIDFSAENNATIRQLVAWYVGGRGHRTFVGTPEQLADEMIEWVDAGAADGFNLMPSLLHNGVDLFVDHVVPRLQQRGRFRREYNDRTLRERYGLDAVVPDRSCNKMNTSTTQTKPVKVAIGQFAAVPEWRANAETCKQFMREAAEGGASILVLPEGVNARFPTLPTAEQFLAADQPITGDFIGELVEASRGNQLTTIVGTKGIVDGERFNTLAVIRNGEVIAHYDKLHLMDAYKKRESDIFVAGRGGLVIVECDGIKVGLMTCYDVRFPEMARLLALAGAQVIALPAAWVAGPQKERHWELLVAARALENTVYVAASGECGPRTVGKSMMVDPLGVVRAQLGYEPGLLWAEIDLDHLAFARRTLPVLENRRFEIDAELLPSPRDYATDPMPDVSDLVEKGFLSREP